MQNHHHKQKQQESNVAGSSVESSLTNFGQLDTNQLLKESFQPKLPNITCTCKIKQFHKWVDNAHDMSHTDDKYTTRDNIEKYFW